MSPQTLLDARSKFDWLLGSSMSPRYEIWSRQAETTIDFDCEEKNGIRIGDRVQIDSSRLRPPPLQVEGPEEVTGEWFTVLHFVEVRILIKLEQVRFTYCILLKDDGTVAKHTEVGPRSPRISLHYIGSLMLV